MIFFKGQAFYFIVLSCLLGIVSSTVLEQFLEKQGNRENILKWCTIGLEEYKKCATFANVVSQDYRQFDTDYFNVKCVNGSGKEDCMAMIEQDKADIIASDAGEVFTGGRYFSLVPILQFMYSENKKTYYTVAVIKKGTLKDVTSLWHLRGKKACFTGVGHLAGWTVPLDVLMKRGGLQTVDCNNQVKNAIEYFGPSCAINSLRDKYNPVGDNSDKLCKLCIGKVTGGKCTNTDPYAGFSGAFRCLVEAGDIAFLKHTTVAELTNSKVDFPSLSRDDFELICIDGSRKHVDEYKVCNWGLIPSPGIITSSAKSTKLRRRYQKFLQRAIQLYGNTDQNRTNSDLLSNNGFKTGREQDVYNSDNAQFGRERDQYGRERDQFGRERDQYGRERDQFGRERDQYGRERDQFGRERDQYGRERDQFGRERDQFGRERDQYGRDYDQSGIYRLDNHNKPDKGFNYNSENRSPFNSSESYQKQNSFNFFESVPRYGIVHNLLVDDATEYLIALEEQSQTYTSYLGHAMDWIMALRDCPVRKMTLCVTSEPEMEKCLKMRTALKAQLLKPEMSCFKGHSHIHCMQAIRNGDADISVFDAGDVYTAGLKYSLVPFMSEVYDLQSPDYYVVAVAKEEDPYTEITYLKGKNTCHGGINFGAGWVVPMAFMLSNGWLRPYGCNAMRAAAEYFSKSCVPGAISTEYNTDVPYDNMCHLCHGSSYTYCRRDASEDYYGHTGAFRCLVEGGGDVAFVKHTTVLENTDGKRREWWVRNALNEDFQLLCPDGTRAALNKFRDCNLGKVRANAIVTRGGDAYNITEINAYINLFIYGQQFYGRRDQDDFNFAMFYSHPPYSDLIFQDASTHLHVIKPELRWYSDYLGKDFMRAKRIVDCHASSNSNLPSKLLLFIALLIFKY
ncbi:melanotransferrin [Cimex lectularius]|uniref:Transferrin-like domain-containing protein n=1 Tax=Cimex lectularius TaxID=79782 RepID=A0A8I6RY64_CIMLE|nr:melanotransferrin [Cimex lectularius]